jgi:hypothetical protein
VFQQVAAVERFHKDGDCAISQCLSADVIVIMGSDENDRELTPFPPNPPLQFRPVHTGEAQVRDDARHARQRAGLQERFRRFEGECSVSSRFQNALNRLANPAIVIHRCDNQVRLPHQDRPFSMPGIVRTPRAAGYYRFI